VSDEIAVGSTGFTKKLTLGLSTAQIWKFLVRFVCPAVIVLVLLNTLGVF
jgi:SNF family Na+-dependent transporter